jgi:hypothetical protein
MNTLMKRRSQVFKKVCGAFDIDGEKENKAGSENRRSCAFCRSDDRRCITPCSNLGLVQLKYPGTNPKTCGNICTAMIAS